MSSVEALEAVDAVEAVEASAVWSALFGHSLFERHVMRIVAQFAGWSAASAWFGLTCGRGQRS